MEWGRKGKWTLIDSNRTNEQYTNVLMTGRGVILQETPISRVDSRRSDIGVVTRATGYNLVDKTFITISRTIPHL